MSEHDAHGAKVHARTSVELGLVVTILLAIVGMAFNAGILWARVTGLETRTGKLEANYDSVHDAQMQSVGQTQGQLATIAAQLAAIKDQQGEIRSQLRKKSGG